MNNIFQFVLTPAGLGEEGAYSVFAAMAQKHGFRAPKPLSHQHAYEAVRKMPRMKLELMLPRGSVTADRPFHQQHVCGINLRYASADPGPEAIAVASDILATFDIHLGGLDIGSLFAAVLGEMTASGQSNPLLAYESAVLPFLPYTSAPRPFMQRLYIWTYIGESFYPTVVAALRSNNFSGVSEAPKGVWIKVGQPSDEGALGLANLRQFWSQFWSQSGLAPARLPGAMGEGLPA